MAACKSCRAPILWALTEARKRIPLDAEPNPADPSRLVPITVEGGGLEVVGWDGPMRVVRAVPKAGNMRTHYASCPNAKGHRRG